MHPSRLPTGAPAVWLALALVVAACSTPPASPAPTPSPAPTTGAAVPIRVLVTRTERGTPVAGARVCAARASAAAPSCTEAATDGTATLLGSQGTYFVRVSGPAGQRWGEATRVADTVGGPVALWVEVEPVRRLSGRITDEDGAPAAGAVACARPTKEIENECATSAADGTYAIDTPPDVYRLEVSGAPGARLVSQWARGRAFFEEADVLDAREADVTGVDVTLVRGVVLRGTVRLAGQPVEEAQVCLRTLAAPLPWECERTDKNGRYAALREPGTYNAWVVPPEDVRAVPQWYDRALTGFGSTPILLRADRSIDFALTPGPQVSGVVRATNGDAVAGAFVCIDTAFSTGRICRETSRNGRYAITTRPETYVVSVIPPAGSGLIGEYWSGKRTWNEADEIVVGADDVTLDLVIDVGTIVIGRVKDSRGIPVAGAYVNFADLAGVADATTTDAAGRFEIVVRPGDFAVEAFPPFPLVGMLFSTRLSATVPTADELVITLGDVAP